MDHELPNFGVIFYVPIFSLYNLDDNPGLIVLSCSINLCFGYRYWSIPRNYRRCYTSNDISAKCKWRDFLLFEFHCVGSNAMKITRLNYCPLSNFLVCDNCLFAFETFAQKLLNAWNVY